VYELHKCACDKLDRSTGSKLDMLTPHTAIVLQPCLLSNIHARAWSAQARVRMHQDELVSGRVQNSLKSPAPFLAFTIDGVRPSGRNRPGTL